MTGCLLLEASTCMLCHCTHAIILSVNRTYTNLHVGHACMVLYALTQTDIRSLCIQSLQKPGHAGMRSLCVDGCSLIHLMIFDWFMEENKYEGAKDLSAILR